MLKFPRTLLQNEYINIKYFVNFFASTYLYYIPKTADKKRECECTP